MKHVLVAFLVMCTSLLCVRTVQALTEQEYQALLEIPYFQQADKDLSSIWKEVYAELQANPAIELCGCKLEKDEIQTPWIRFSAEVVFEERQDIRDAIIEKSAIVNALYKNMRQNPIFKVFYLKHIDGWLTNFGNVKGLEHKAEFAKPVHFRF